MISNRVTIANLCSLAVLAFLNCTLLLAAADDVSLPLCLESPNRHLRVMFRLDEQGRAAFEVAHGGAPVASGTLAVEFAGSGLLAKGLRVVRTRRASRNKTYDITVGKALVARDQHQELVVSLEETSSPNRKLDILFRAFDDGMAFQYMCRFRSR